MKTSFIRPEEAKAQANKIGIIVMIFFLLHVEISL